MVREIPPKKARQGNNSPRTLIVLGVSLVGAFVVLGLAYVFFFSGSYPENPLNRENRPAVTGTTKP